MHIAAYVLAGLLFLAAIGSLGESVGVGIFYALLGAGLVWWGKKRSSRNSAESKLSPGIKVTVSRGRQDNKREEITDLIQDITGEFVFDPCISPNGRFAVIDRDGHFEEDRWVKGKLILVDISAKKTLWSKAIDRPHNSKVANNGSVLVEDWQSHHTLGGSVIMFDESGAKLWKHEFKANIGSSGISQNCAQAFVATLRTEYEPHNTKLFLFDASNGAELWSRDAYEKEGAPYECEFSGDQLVAVVKTVEEGVQRFPFDGAGNLPKEYYDFSFELEVRQRGLAAVLLPKVKAMLGKEPPEIDQANELLSRLNVDELSPEPKAQALRYIGEVEEIRGNLEGAAEAWRQALELNPNVGIKGRYQSLQKRLES
jgi:hypothetical protein